MKIENSPLLDALCGEYLLGTLRGAARRRFERAQREEPRTALRLKHWQQIFAPRYSRTIETQPSLKVWNRLERELGLSRYRAPPARSLRDLRKATSYGCYRRKAAHRFRSPCLAPSMPASSLRQAMLSGCAPGASSPFRSSRRADRRPVPPPAR